MQLQKPFVDLLRTFTTVILANELDGNINAAYRFSDAGGKSGLSFGICQLDVSHNPAAILALRDMNFTSDEISLLKAKTADMKAMNAKLAQHAATVDRWDSRQLQECLTVPLGHCTEIGLDMTGDETFIHIADYHNQFYMSKGGKLYNWLKAQTVPVSPEMIRDFKLALPWGQKAPGDVMRRYKNIVRIMRG